MQHPLFPCAVIAYEFLCIIGFSIRAAMNGARAW